MGAGMEVVVGRQAGQSPMGAWSHVGRCRSISRVRGEYTDYTRSHHHPGASLGRVEPELDGLPGEALARYATRRLRFVVNAAGSLHSMVLHGRYMWWSQGL